MIRRFVILGTVAVTLSGCSSADFSLPFNLSSTLSRRSATTEERAVELKAAYAIVPKELFIELQTVEDATRVDRAFHVRYVSTGGRNALYEAFQHIAGWQVEDASVAQDQSSLLISNDTWRVTITMTGGAQRATVYLTGEQKS